MPPKGSGKAAMAAAAAAAAAANTPKQSKIVTFKLSPEALSKFPGDSSSKESSLSAKNSPGAEAAEDTPKTGTPAPTAPERKKPGPPKGTKRKADALLPDGTPKPRGKPGPKKRKLDGTDADGRPWTTPAAGVGAHKLGPKANQGAINAGLRALDRTGKPCRKWTKKPITLKSFTGQVWSLSTWGAPRRPRADGDGTDSSTPGAVTAPNGGAASADDSNKENNPKDADADDGKAPDTPAPSSDAGRATPADLPNGTGTCNVSQAGTPVPTAA